MSEYFKFQTVINNKCKNCAKSLKIIAFIFDIAGSLLAGLSMLVGINIYKETDILLFAYCGIVLAFVIMIISHAFTTLLYGFAKLIIDTEKNKNATEKLLEITCSINGIKYEKTKKVPVESPCFNETKQKQEQLQQKIKAIVANPNVDEEEYIDIVCPNCNAELSYTKGELQSGEGLTCPMCDAPINVL